jgi:hypothetical protein
MKLLSGICLPVILLFLSSCANQASTPPVQETLTVDFKNGNQGALTSKSYSGPIAIQVEGGGQASGLEQSDAFYIYTDSNGNDIQPWHPTEFYNWSLWVNGAPVDASVSSIPAYNASHIYVFIMEAPGGQLNFAVGDTGIDDNSGSYTISILE